MNNNHNRLAIRSILLLGFLIAAVVGVKKVLASEMWTELTQQLGAATVSSPSLSETKTFVARIEARPKPIIVAPEPEIRRAIPVDHPPIVAEPPVEISEMTVEVGPKRWSKLVEVPAGTSPSVSFTLGRIRIQRNGEEVGTFFRNAMVRSTKNGPANYTFRFIPFAMLDRSPRIIDFDSGTQNLRFLSLEKSTGDVLVEFSK